MPSPEKYKLTAVDRRRILALVIPALIESLLSLTFGAIDTVMLGHSSDATVSLSAVSISTSIINLVICVLNGYLVGQTATVARYMGSGERDKLQSFVRQSCTVNLILGAVLSVVFCSLTDVLVNFLNPADPEIHAAAITYYRIVSAAFGFHFFMISVSSLFRGCGETRIPLLYGISSNLVNVLFNYLLIYGKWGFPEWGIKGAAVATALSHGIGAVFAMLLLLFLDCPVRISFKGSFIPRWRVMAPSVKIGLGGGAEQFLLQFGNVLYTRIITGLPKVSLSAHSVVQTINGYTWGSAGSLNVASTTLMGNSVGEGREDKALTYARTMYRSGAVVGVILALFVILLRTPLASLITDDKDVIAVASACLIPSAMSALGVCIHNPLGGSLRAAGDTKSPLTASFISLWVFRVGISFLCVRILHLGIFWGWVATASDQWVRATINLFLFRKGKWKKRFIKKEEGAAG